MFSHDREVTDKFKRKGCSSKRLCNTIYHGESGAIFVSLNVPKYLQIRCLEGGGEGGESSK